MHQKHSSVNQNQRTLQNSSVILNHNNNNSSTRAAVQQSGNMPASPNSIAQRNNKKALFRLIKK